MILPHHLKSQKIAVLGLGKTGLSTACSLTQAGVDAVLWDDEAAKRQAAEKLGYTLVNLADDKNWDGIQALVTSPGIPNSFPKPHKVITIAKDKKIPFFCDIELLFQSAPDASYIGITGTNGKSTTTSLIGHIMKAHDPATEVGGNLGRPVLEMKKLNAGEAYVLELSSYQLELSPSAVFDVAILLNITPDHLDRHGSLEGYAKAKENIFKLARQNKKQTFLIGVDDKLSKKIYEDLQKSVATVIPFSVVQKLDRGIYVKDGWLVDGYFEAHKEIVDLTDIPSLPGVHNWQNAAAAYGAARAMGLEAKFIVEHMRDFPGLEHRQELVTTKGTITFVNDSKATNADSTSKALACYDNIYLIAGGQAKEEGLDTLKKFYPKINKVYLIGEAEDRFASEIDGKLEYARCGKMEAAVANAYKDAMQDKKPSVILLSPLCASWDQYDNFEHRGKHFKSIVGTLTGAGS